MAVVVNLDADSPVLCGHRHAETMAAACAMFDGVGGQLRDTEPDVIGPTLPAPVRKGANSKDASPAHRFRSRDKESLGGIRHDEPHVSVSRSGQSRDGGGTLGKPVVPAGSWPGSSSMLRLHRT